MRKKKTTQNQVSGISLKESFGQKHLVKCRCVLPQMKKSSNPIAHQFLVFSEVIDGIVKTKYSQCNNCGVIHKITDICTSEIMDGKEAMNSIISINDIKTSINPNLSAILERNNCDLPAWEHARYITENKRWGDIVILTSDNEGDDKVIKYVKIVGENLFKVDLYTRKDILGE